MGQVLVDWVQSVAFVEVELPDGICNPISSPGKRRPSDIFEKEDMVIGLTGGLACGKSTAARLFAECGARVLDTDVIVHELYEHDSEVRQALVERFGAGIMDAKEKVDRKKIGAIVFNDSSELSWLESLIHPRVRKAWESQVAANPEAFWVVEIPLLFEKKLENLFDYTVCVSASPATQIERRQAEGLPEDQIKKRIAQQLPMDEKIRRADFVITNNGSIEFLKDQVELLIKQL